MFLRRNYLISMTGSKDIKRKLIQKIALKQTLGHNSIQRSFALEITTDEKREIETFISEYKYIFSWSYDDLRPIKEIFQ